MVVSPASIPCSLCYRMFQGHAQAPRTLDAFRVICLGQLKLVTNLSSKLLISFFLYVRLPLLQKFMATIAIPTSFITPFGDQGTTVFDIQNQSNLTMPSSAATCLIACYGALHTELATLSHQTLENVDIFADFTDNHTPLNPTNERLSITQLFVGCASLMQILRYISFVEDIFRVPFSVFWPLVECLTVHSTSPPSRLTLAI
jgi:hypothetical protein